MGRRTAICAALDFFCGVFFIFSAITLCRSLDDDVAGMKIGPAGASFAAERAIALVDEVRLLWDLDADLAAETMELQHSRVIARALPARKWPFGFPESRNSKSDNQRQARYFFTTASISTSCSSRPEKSF